VSIRVLIHVLNEEAVLAEIDRMPGPQDNCLTAKNPRRRDGKPLPTIMDGVTTLVYPWTRITFLEILDGSEEEQEASDGIVGFFREESRAATRE
jgi:hypothetical protein